MGITLYTLFTRILTQDDTSSPERLSTTVTSLIETSRVYMSLRQEFLITSYGNVISYEERKLTLEPSAFNVHNNLSFKRHFEY